MTELTKFEQAELEEFKAVQAKEFAEKQAELELIAKESRERDERKRTKDAELAQAKHQMFKKLLEVDTTTRLLSKTKDGQIVSVYLRMPNSHTQDITIASHNEYSSEPTKLKYEIGGPLVNYSHRSYVNPKTIITNIVKYFKESEERFQAKREAARDVDRVLAKVTEEFPEFENELVDIYSRHSSSSWKNVKVTTEKGVVFFSERLDKDGNLKISKIDYNMAQKNELAKQILS